jgi:nucleotide-binding universal stress UspA family protein
VPLDGSALAEEAIPLAQRLAERLHVPVHLITAFDAMSAHRTWLGPVVAFDAETYQETLAQLNADADAFLARTGEQLTNAGVACTREVLHGSPFWTIASAVEEGDVIVMTSHGRSGVRRWLLGSLAEKLVRESPVPVILVPVAARQPARSGSKPVAN